MRSALSVLAVLFSAAPAAAAGPCLTLTVLGRTLPGALVTLSSDPRSATPGPSERSFARMRGGRLCFDDLAPGGYKIAVRPLGVPEAMPLAAAGASAPLEDLRVEVSDGGFLVRSPSGETLRPASKELALEYRAPEPAADWPRVIATLSYPGGVERDEPSVFMTCVQDRGCFFAPLSGKLEAGRQSVELSAPPGRLGQFRTSSLKFAPGASEPAYSPRGSEALSLTPGLRLTLGLTMYPACRLSGRFAFAADQPKPYDGARGADAVRFSATMINPWATHQATALVDSDLRYEFDAMPMGFWELKPGWRGAGKLALGQLPPPGKWLTAGRDETLDYAFTDEARLRLDPAGLRARSPWQKAFSEMFPIALRLVGPPAGDFDPYKTLRFFLEPSFPIGLEEMKPGSWQAMAPGESDKTDWARVAPGRYDLYLVRNVRWLDFLGTRVLAVRKGVVLEKGRTLDFKFEPGDYYPLGDGRIEGTVRYKRRWDWPRAYSSRTLERFEFLFSFIVNVYDEQGRFVALAIGNMGNGEYDALAGPLLAGDSKALDEAHFNGRPRDFRVKGLAPGRYKIQVAMEGHPLREMEATVEDGKTTRVAFDMEAM